LEYKVGDLLYETYRVVDVIKTGGFGVVYVCCFDNEWHAREPPKFLFVLKSFKDEFFKEEDVVEDFYHEAEVWIRVGLHPNIVTAFNVLPIGEKPHILMEFVDGGNLADWIRDRVIDVRMFSDLSLQFCKGMIYANSKDFGEGKRGIVHRDLKPTNILLTKEGLLKITDFGLVKALGAPTAERITGTPEYMSPEQFETMDVDTRSDIYSFGVVLYEMFTGKGPFPEPYDPELRWRHYKHYHQNVSPEFPALGKTMVEMLTEKSTESQTIITKLKDVILRCLEKSPEDRYETFNELEKELKEIREDHPWTLRRVFPYKEISIGDLSSDTRKELLLHLGASLMMLGKDREAIQHFDKVLEIDPRDVSAWIRKGAALAGLGRPEEALKHVERAIQLDPRNAYAWGLKGDFLGRLGRYEEALKCFDRAIDLDPKNAFSLWLGKGDCLSRLGRCQEALRCIEKAIDLGPREPIVWEIKGNALERLGRHEEALTCYDRAIQLNPRSARAWDSKGDCLSRLGRFDEALKCYERARELRNQ